MITIKRKILLILFGIAGLSFNAVPLLSQKKFSLQGTVYEMSASHQKQPLPGASLVVEASGIGTTSDVNGDYTLTPIFEGEIRLKVSFIGKVTVDTLLKIHADTSVDFILKEDNFRLKEVVVTVEPGQSGQSTSSTISHKAIEHLQSVSLNNVLALLPGGITANPNLNHASQINIRTVGNPNGWGGSAMNALGATIIQDGSPLSNNANLQAMHPAVLGNLGALGGTASPGGGLDTRNISLENIESVEVIRGIPSAEYGDLTSGAVLVKSKAGKTPLTVKARTNPNIYHFFAQKGTNLGKNRGDLNLSADYTYNVNTPVQSYRYYRRFSSKAIYSNVYLDNRWKSNTIVDFMYGQAKRDRNPDDKITETVSSGKDAKLSLNTNGTIYFKDKSWLKNIRYALSGSYTDKKSHYEELYTAANAPYSMTTVDGAVITNKPGLDLYDVDGKKITDYTHVNPSDRAVFLPSTYKGKYDIYGKEINAFAKLSATLFKRWGKTDHRILLGGEYRLEGNVGKGKVFDRMAPPYRNLQALNATFRPRAYKDIPFIRHGSFFVEENLTAHLTPNNQLRVQAGLRYDMMKDVENVLSPRINASFEMIPQKVFLKAGYGVTAKMPTLVYLYPEKAYFEYININEIPNDKIPKDQRIFMTTTRVFDTRNHDLKAATNTKAELGADFLFDDFQLYVTAFKEHLKNGYSMSPRFNPVTFKQYKRAGGKNQPVYKLSAAHPVLAEYYVPSNHLVMNSKGIEFDLRINRINAIRTAFSFSGAYIENENYQDTYTYYDNSGEGGASRTHVGLYGPAMSKHKTDRFSTALRATHNIPEIGFVVTLTMETVWSQRDRYTFGNDTVPVAYISKNDGKQYDFDPSRKDEPEFKSILRRRNDALYIVESIPPLFNFNINITKEIRNFMRVSFFANNMFRYYPVVESKRNPGSFYQGSGGFLPVKDFFFGLEVNLLIH